VVKENMRHCRTSDEAYCPRDISSLLPEILHGLAELKNWPAGAIAAVRLIGAGCVRDHRRQWLRRRQDAATAGRGGERGAISDGALYLDVK